MPITRVVTKVALAASLIAGTGGGTGIRQKRVEGTVSPGQRDARSAERAVRSWVSEYAAQESQLYVPRTLIE